MTTCCPGWSSGTAWSPTRCRATGATSASRTSTSRRTASCCATTADVFDHPGWPILTRQPQRAPARVLDGAVVVDSLLSPGCRVEGRVERSVLGPGVVVAAGAVVRDSVVFPDTVVEAGATVDWAVVDERCRIGEGARVGAAADADPDGPVDPDLVSVVGRETSVPAGATLEPGSRLEPGTTS